MSKKCLVLKTNVLSTNLYSNLQVWPFTLPTTAFTANSAESAPVKTSTFEAISTKSRW